VSGRFSKEDGAQGDRRAAIFGKAPYENSGRLPREVAQRRRRDRAQGQSEAEGVSPLGNATFGGADRRSGSDRFAGSAAGCISPSWPQAPHSTSTKSPAPRGLA